MLSYIQKYKKAEEKKARKLKQEKLIFQRVKNEIILKSDRV